MLPDTKDSWGTRIPRFGQPAPDFGGGAMRPIRIFVSSPMDVSSERTIAKRVIERLALEYVYHFRIEAVMSELEPISAADTPQATILPPSETDIVVVLLWSRLGTPLPNDPRFKIEGTNRQPTGTEWEFYNALRANQERGTPDLLVYRKTEKLLTNLDDEKHVLESLDQKRELERFFSQWFRASDGTWKAWFHRFEKEDELEHLLETHLQKLIELRIETDPQTDDRATTKVIEGNPYRGLQSFDTRDSLLFFGRTSALNELREVLDTQNASRRGFVLVTGGSGSGKSSLVKAGLLADLKNPYRIGRVAHVRHAIMRPTDHDAKITLAVANAIISPTAFPEIQQVGWTAAELSSTLIKEPQRVIDALRHATRVIAKANALHDETDIRLCVVIDQLEEIFTAGVPISAIQEFTRVLTLFARSEIVWIVATLRSDFYHRIEEHPDLMMLAERGYYRLKPPFPTELGQMIRKPAQLAGLRFQKDSETGIGLDAVLQDEAVSDPTALALLEFALTELWNQRSPEGLLTFEAYRRMGRMTGAIAERAEGLIATLSTGSREHLAPTLRALLTIGGSDLKPTAATVSRSRITTSVEREEILDKLIGARLVVTDDLENRGDPKCRLAHEKLIETWPRLRMLAEADATFLEVRSRLRHRAEEWEKAQRRRDFLLTPGSQLSEGEAAIRTRRDELDQLIIEYIEASVTADKLLRDHKLRQSRRVAAGFGLLAMLALILLAYSMHNKRQLLEATRVATLSADRANKGFTLAVQAAGELSETAGTAGTRIEQVMDDADSVLERISEANRDAPDDVLLKRAALLLHFSETSERFGNFDRQNFRITSARRILESVCEHNKKKNNDCSTILADAYELQGNFYNQINKYEDAIRNYKAASDIRSQVDFNIPGMLEPLLSKAKTMMLVSRSLLRMDQTQPALDTALQCIQILKSVVQNSSSQSVVLQHAWCNLIAAEASTTLSKADQGLDDAVNYARNAFANFSELQNTDGGNPQLIEGLAQTYKALAGIYYKKGELQQALITLDNAIHSSELQSRLNPLNNNMGTLLDAIYRDKVAVLSKLGRHDLASSTNEARLELASSRYKITQMPYWHDIWLRAMGDTFASYQKLDRRADALALARQEIDERLAQHKSQQPNQPYPPALLERYYATAYYAAHNSKDGLEAFTYYDKILEHADKFVFTNAQVNNASMSSLRRFAYAAANIGFIPPAIVPNKEQVRVYETIVSHLQKLVDLDPRVIQFRRALGASLYSLASTYDRLGRVQAALETHLRASNTGHRDSTIVLRRWFSEGYGQIKKDLERAREFEVLSQQQEEPVEFTSSTVSGERQQISDEELLLDTGNDWKRALDDEIYRLKKYQNAELTPETRASIEKMYAYASAHNKSLKDVAADWRSANSETISRLDQAVGEIKTDIQLHPGVDGLLRASDHLKSAIKEMSSQGDDKVLEEANEWVRIPSIFHWLQGEASRYASNDLSEKFLRSSKDSLSMVLVRLEGAFDKLKRENEGESQRGLELIDMAGALKSAGLLAEEQKDVSLSSRAHQLQARVLPEAFNMVMNSLGQLRTIGNDDLAAIIDGWKKVSIALSLVKGHASDRELNDLVGRVIEQEKNVLRERNNRIATVVSSYKVGILSKETVLRWGLIMLASGDIEKEANILQMPDIVTFSSHQKEAVLQQMLSSDVLGSSPKLDLAEVLEFLANYSASDSFGQGVIAIRLYQRAIELRVAVQLEDPKNSTCACNIAHDWMQISKLHESSNNLAPAIDSMTRSFEIVEGLNRREPDRNWGSRLIEAALSLSKLHQSAKSPILSYYYSKTAVDIQKATAESHSASSKVRIEYASSLEIAAEHLVLLAATRDDKVKLTEEAIDLLREANSIRESVLSIDPQNGECRCHVARNLAIMGRYFESIGRQDEYIAALDSEISIHRKSVSEKPYNIGLKHSLAQSLGRRAETLTGKGLLAESVVYIEEELDLYRILQKGEPANIEWSKGVKSALFNLSFYRLFIGKKKEALEAADEALGINVDTKFNLPILMNRAHALMYLERREEARQIYLKYKGVKFVNRDASWDEGMLNDFQILEKAGLGHPLMQDVKLKLKSVGGQKT